MTLLKKIQIEKNYI